MLWCIVWPEVQRSCVVYYRLHSWTSNGGVFQIKLIRFKSWSGHILLIFTKESIRTCISAEPCVNTEGVGSVGLVRLSAMAFDLCLTAGPGEDVSVGSCRRLISPALTPAQLIDSTLWDLQESCHWPSDKSLPRIPGRLNMSSGPPWPSLLCLLTLSYTKLMISLRQGTPGRFLCTSIWNVAHNAENVHNYVFGSTAKAISWIVKEPRGVNTNKLLIQPQTKIRSIYMFDVVAITTLIPLVKNSNHLVCLCSISLCLVFWLL